MVRMILTDLKKLVGHYHIYAFMLGLGCIYILAYFEMAQGQTYMGSFAEGLGYIRGNEILLLCFLICIVGGSFLYCAEEKYGYLKFEIQRVGISVFTISKLIISVIGGFITAIVGVVISMCGIIVILFCKYEDKSLIWGEFDYLEYIVWVWIFQALLCGVLSAIGFVVTTFVANYYIGMTAPLLLYYVILELEGWIQIPKLIEFTTVYTQVRGIREGYLFYFVYAVLYTIGLCVLFYIIAKKQIQRRLEHA